MAQFNLTWFNNAVIINPNVTGQRVSHRRKSLGGSFSSTGYNPTNDLPKTASASQSPVLANNQVWEFKMDTLCSEGGPTMNDNGLIEGLKFACLQPSISNLTNNTATITLNVINTDITSATFTIHKDSDDTVVAGPTTINKVGNSITYNVTGLSSDTVFYVETILYAIVNGSQIQSNDTNQLNASCISVSTFTTLSTACLPITNITASVIEA